MTSLDPSAPKLCSVRDFYTDDASSGLLKAGEFVGLYDVIAYAHARSLNPISSALSSAKF